MKIEEAIKQAIEYETRVRETYVEAMDTAVDKVGLKVFKLLADEENGHVEYLEHKLVQWTEQGQLSADDLETAIPSVEMIDTQAAKLGEKLETSGNETEVALLKKAYDVELETSNFYKKLVSELPTEGREFFRRFMEIEEGHVALVKAEMDALTGSGHWFDMAEFDLEKA